MLQPKASQSDSLSPIPGLPVACVDVETGESEQQRREEGGGAHFLQGPPPVKNVTLRKEVQLLHYYTFIYYFVFKGVITKIKAP